MAENVTVENKKKPWYTWVLGVVWALILLFLLQNAVGSNGELESRATVLFWIFFAIWLVAGVVIWFTRRKK